MQHLSHYGMDSVSATSKSATTVISNPQGPPLLRQPVPRQPAEPPLATAVVSLQRVAGLHVFMA
jgi:hypothetical protein